jgi:Methylase involved in ubiquinone/menaquinone biosynthesis
MPAILVPPRIRGEEILDRAGIAPEIMTRTLGDVAKANALFGGVRAVLSELEAALPSLPREASLLDVATGAGDIPKAAAKMLARHGIELTTVGLDSSEALARASGCNVTASVRADALRLPFASRSVDIVICSQFLHHLLPDEADALIREMNRVARIRVIISDIRRSWIAAGGLWVASFPLRFHPISRHDGVVSVMRGFTRTELSGFISRALGIGVAPTRRPGFRITAGWTPIRL